MAENENKNSTPTLPTFKGSELIRAASGVTRDILSIVLTPEERYTESDANKKLEAYLQKGKKKAGEK